MLGIEGVDESRLAANMPPLLTGGRACVITRNEPAQKPERKPSRSRPRCCSTARCVRGSRSSSRTATSPCSARSARARRSSPADRSTSTARCAAARWRASTAIRSARIYCQKIEAELLAIDGYYQTAEEIDVSLRNRPGTGLAGRRHHENYPAELTGSRRSRMAKVLVVTSGKGGVGKTTIDGRARRGAGAKRAERRGRRFRRRPAQPRPRDGRRTPRGVRPHQRGAGRRQAAAGADPRQAAGKSLAAAGLADPRQGCADRRGRRPRHRRAHEPVRLDPVRQPGRHRARRDAGHALCR